MKTKIELTKKEFTILKNFTYQGIERDALRHVYIFDDSDNKKVYAVATHALLLQNAKYRIFNAGADEIIGSDSIDNEAAKVSLSKTIADYLK